MSSLFLMVTITDRRSTDAFLQLYQQRGVDVNLRTVGSRKTRFCVIPQAARSARGQKNAPCWKC